MKGFLIDPWTATIDEIEQPEDHDALKRLLDAPALATLAIQGARDKVVASARFGGRGPCFRIGPGGHAIRSRGLVIGIGDRGERLPPAASLDDLRRLVLFDEEGGRGPRKDHLALALAMAIEHGLPRIVEKARAKHWPRLFLLPMACSGRAPDDAILSTAVSAKLTLSKANPIDYVWGVIAGAPWVRTCILSARDPALLALYREGIARRTGRYGDSALIGEVTEHALAEGGEAAATAGDMRLLWAEVRSALATVEGAPGGAATLVTFSCPPSLVPVVAAAFAADGAARMEPADLGRVADGVHHPPTDVPGIFTVGDSDVARPGTALAGVYTRDPAWAARVLTILALLAEGPPTSGLGDGQRRIREIRKTMH